MNRNVCSIINLIINLLEINPKINKNINIANFKNYASKYYKNINESIADNLLQTKIKY